MEKDNTQPEGMEDKDKVAQEVFDKLRAGVGVRLLTEYVNQQIAAAEKRMVERVIEYLEPQAPHIGQELRERYLNHP